MTEKIFFYANWGLLRYDEMLLIFGGIECYKLELLEINQKRDELFMLWSSKFRKVFIEVDIDGNQC